MVICSAMRTMVPLLNSPASGDSGAGRRDCRDRPAPACWSGRTCPFAPVPRPGGPGGTVRRHRAPRAPGCGQVSQPGRSLTAHQVPIEELCDCFPMRAQDGITISPNAPIVLTVPVIVGSLLMLFALRKSGGWANLWYGHRPVAVSYT